MFFNWWIRVSWEHTSSFGSPWELCGLYSRIAIMGSRSASVRFSWLHVVHRLHQLPTAFAWLPPASSSWFTNPLRGRLSNTFRPPFPAGWLLLRATDLQFLPTVST